MEVLLNISETKKADVLVVGGGTAGVFAAIAAAKSGAKTLLIEKNSVLGGTMTVANVNFPGLFFAWGEQIITGPCWESIERTVALGGATLPEISFRPKKHYHEQIKLNRFVYTAVLFEMCKEAGVEVITNTMLTSAEERSDGVCVIATRKSGTMAIEAKIVVDATGDANLVEMAGYEVVKSRIQQPATLQNHLSGYLYEDISSEDVASALSEADLPEYITVDTLMHDLLRNKFDIHIPCVNADTSEGKTKVEQDAYAMLLKLYQLCRGIKGLENIVIDFVAEETGIRETNRIVGEDIITAEDYIRGKMYKDSVCYAFYPIDLHVMNGIEQRFHEEHVVSKVPYGALIPKNAKRILCAGRCISSDTYANSGVRVEAVCMATGQAAGCAAAIATKDNCNVKQVKYNDICKELKVLGAVVPK